MKCLARDPPVTSKARVVKLLQGAVSNGSTSRLVAYRILGCGIASAGGSVMVWRAGGHYRLRGRAGEVPGSSFTCCIQGSSREVSIKSGFKRFSVTLALLGAPRYSSLLLATPRSCLLLLATPRYSSLLLATARYCSLLLATAAASTSRRDEPMRRADATSRCSTCYTHRRTG